MIIQYYRQNVIAILHKNRHYCSFKSENMVRRDCFNVLAVHGFNIQGD